MKPSPILVLAIAACGPSHDPSPGGDDGDRPDAKVVDAAPLVDATEATPADMVEIPAGSFLMGCDTCGADEAPRHAVTLSRYAIDKTEVSQAAYAMCVTAGTCTAPAMAYTPATTPLLPVVSVTWNQAVAYCTFAGKRLPTEAEWEKAARGPDGRSYPWGGTAEDCNLANTSGCGGKALDVGGRAGGASPYGALDMAGNVWEWVHDYYAARAYDGHAGEDPQGPPTGTSRVYRGGSAGNTFDLASATNRADTYNPEVGGTGLGFRCAK